MTKFDRDAYISGYLCACVILDQKIKRKLSTWPRRRQQRQLCRQKNDRRSNWTLFVISKRPFRNNGQRLRSLKPMHRDIQPASKIDYLLSLSPLVILLQCQYLRGHLSVSVHEWSSAFGSHILLVQMRSSIRIASLTSQQTNNTLF